jgi:hypothetical protein
VQSRTVAFSSSTYCSSKSEIGGDGFNDLVTLNKVP